MNPWQSRRVIGWAHQGGPEDGRRPSTIDTMRHALTTGIHALEVDVHLTADTDGKVLVVHHDPFLDIPGPRHEIRTTCLKDLCDADGDLATLDQVLDTFPGVPMTVEVKAPEAVGAAAQRLSLEVGRRPLIVTAFSPKTVRALKRAAPTLETAPAGPAILAFWVLAHLRIPVRIARNHVALQVPLRLDQVKYLKAIPVLRRLKVSTHRLVRVAHKQGLAVHVWTLDDDVQIREALEAYADGIMTNCPSVLMPILETYGSWSG